MLLAIIGDICFYIMQINNSHARTYGEPTLTYWMWIKTHYYM